MGMHLDLYQRITIDPCSLTVIHYTERRPFVQRVNDVGGSVAGLGKTAEHLKTAAQAPAGDGDDLPRGDLVVDEEYLDALAHREVRRLAERRGELLQVVVKEHPEHVAAVPSRQPPRRGAQDVVLAALRIGQEPALPQRVRQAEDAAAVDADQVGELLQRDGVRRSRDGFENRQAAVETLDRRCVGDGFAARRHNVWRQGYRGTLRILPLSCRGDQC